MTHYKMVEQAKKHWSKVGKNNGWQIGKRGVTVWTNPKGKMVDSYVNPPNNNNTSYIIDQTTEKIIKKIQHKN